MSLCGNLNRAAMENHFRVAPRRVPAGPAASCARAGCRAWTGHPAMGAAGMNAMIGSQGKEPVIFGYTPDICARQDVRLGYYPPEHT